MSLWQVSLIAASQFLHAALDARAYFRSVTILLPESWDDSCSPRYVTSSSGERPDFRVGPTHPVFGDGAWTQQSQGCGRPGDFVYTSYRPLLDSRNLGETDQSLHGSIILFQNVALLNCVSSYNIEYKGNS